MPPYYILRHITISFFPLNSQTHIKEKHNNNPESWAHQCLRLRWKQSRPWVQHRTNASFLAPMDIPDFHRSVQKSQMWATDREQNRCRPVPQPVTRLWTGHVHKYTTDWAGKFVIMSHLNPTPLTTTRLTKCETSKVLVMTTCGGHVKQQDPLEKSYITFTYEWNELKHYSPAFFLSVFSEVRRSKLKWFYYYNYGTFASNEPHLCRHFQNETSKIRLELLNAQRRRTPSWATDINSSWKKSLTR